MEISQNSVAFSEYMNFTDCPVAKILSRPLFQMIMRLFSKFVKGLLKEVEWLLMEVIKPNKTLYEHINKVRRSCNSQQGSTCHVKYSLNFISILS